MKKTPLSFYADDNCYDNLYNGLNNIDWDLVDPDGKHELNYQVECARQDEGCEAFSGFEVVYNALVDRNLLTHPEAIDIVAWLHADDGDEINECYVPDGYGEGFKLHVCSIYIGSAVRLLRAMYDDGCGFVMPSALTTQITTTAAAVSNGNATDVNLIHCLKVVYEELTDPRVQDYEFTEDIGEDSPLQDELDGNPRYYLYR